MKKYTNPEIEVMLLENGDILTFSKGQLEELDPTGTDGPVVDATENRWAW